jgi:hypothetical protein
MFEKDITFEKRLSKLGTNTFRKRKRHAAVAIHIMNIQGWLRVILHYCSKERMQGYLDEYHFRYNRRAIMGLIFDFLIKRMVLSEPKSLIKNKITTVL